MDKVSEQVRDLLPGKYEHIDERMKKALERSPDYASAGIPGFLWKTIGDEATDRIDEALDMNVFALFAKGWRETRAIRKHAQDSIDNNEPITLNIARHKASANVTVDVQVRIDPMKAITVPFEVEVSAVFEPLRMRLEKGAITKVWSGQCNVEGVLKLAGEPLHKAKKSRSVVMGPPLQFEPGLQVIELQPTVA